MDLNIAERAFQLSDVLASMFPQRQSSPSETSFFQANPNVSGYAAPEGDVVLNPTLPQSQWPSVLLNERLRQFMTSLPGLVPPTMTIAEHQTRNIGGPYTENPSALQETILARLLSGDPSGYPYTAQQYEAAQGVLTRLEQQRQKGE